MNVQTAKKALDFRNRTNSPYGTECFFVPIDKKWGVKVYKSRSNRNHAYLVQKKLSKHKLAPPVGAKFSLGYDKHCYITRIAQVVIHDAQTTDYQLYDEIETLHLPGIEYLEEKIENLTGTPPEDLHAGNIGILDGEYVVIDTGRATEINPHTIP
jgi:hypothetical protein